MSSRPTTRPTRALGSIPFIVVLSAQSCIFHARRELIRVLGVTGGVCKNQENGVIMEYWNAEYLLRNKGNHVASERHVRIDVHDIVSPIRPPHHGELLLVILHGTCSVRTEKSSHIANAGDQVLIVDGDEFEIAPVVDKDIATVQFIWTPGLNPCRFCWETNNRFYGKKDD